MSKTHWKKLNNPNYLGAYALDPDSDMVLTIKEAKQEEVTGTNGKKEECLVVHFEEKDIQPLILNVTNAKQIQGLCGSPYIEDWVGLKIALYIAQVHAFGETVDAVRIRNYKPADKPELTPDHEKWLPAVENLSVGETSIKAIKKHYALTAEYEQILKDEAGI